MNVNLRQSKSGGRHGFGLLVRGPGFLASPAARTVLTSLILAGAILTVISGVIHLYLWGEPNGYRQLPTIGPLFLAQGISAVLIGLLTAASRWLAVTLVAAGLLASTAMGLVISVEHGLFGFRETWSAPYARTSLYEEIIGAALLLAAAVPLALARAASEP